MKKLWLLIALALGTIPAFGQANDFCSGAIALTAGVTVTASTSAATSTGDPIPDCTDTLQAVKGIWYTFTPPSNGSVTVKTCGSGFDTVVAAFTGPCGSLVNLACNDDSPACASSQNSVIQFNGVSGTTYRILAGGYAGDSGSLSIVALMTPFGTPNIVPHQPSGWSDRVVVTRIAGATVDDTILASDTAWVSWAVGNFGSGGAPEFNISLYVDGWLSNIWTSGASGLPAGNYVYETNYSIGTLPSGTHTIRMVGDSFYVVPESNESDNQYVKTFAVAPAMPLFLNGISISNHVFRFVVNGPANRNCVILASPNLTAWQPLSTNQIGGNGTVVITDSTSTNVRFYRAMLQ